tara:strand:- start:2030 stop:2536 length:507 start_codon:yes stop_codon:yes gene_type:complete
MGEKKSGSDKIKPELIKTKSQLEKLIRAGKVGHISNAKLAEIGLRTGYIKMSDFMAKGGMASKMKKKGMAKGGMKKKGMAMGGMKKKGMSIGGLKKPAAGQTGLKKLPTSVRNKMGYAKNGGMMKKKGMARGGMKKKGYAMGGMSVKYKVGGMAKGKMYGMVDKKKKK